MVKEIHSATREHANNTQKRGYLKLKKTTYQALMIILLKEVEQVQRCALKPYCFEITTKDKSYYFACEADSDLYSWIEEIYSVINFKFSALHVEFPLLQISLTTYTSDSTQQQERSKLQMLTVGIA